MAVFTYPAISIAPTLPPGAATEAKQDSQIVELQSVNSELDSQSTTLTSIDSKVTAVDTTGKSTEAKQDDAITQLTTIAGDTTSLDGKVTAVDTNNVTITSSALPTGASTAANQATTNSSLSNIEADIDALNARLAGNLVPETFDYIAITYVAAGNGAGEIETVAYRNGGAAGTLQATLTLAYDASNRLTSVTRS